MPSNTAQPGEARPKSFLATLKDTIKHSSIYAVGQILGRAASILLLPIYTRYLAPQDYGIIAILDLAAGFLAVVVGGGIGNAMTRYHFDTRDPAARPKVWYTGLTFVFLLSAAVFAGMLLVRDPAADLLLGTATPERGLLFSLSLATVAITISQEVFLAYWTCMKWSKQLVLYSLFRLALNAAINLTLLIKFDLGVHAVLWGNLVTAAIGLLIVSRPVVRALGQFSASAQLLGKLIKFGYPLVVTDLIMFLLQQSDNFLLRLYHGLDAVGLYSLAGAMAQAAYLLVIMPFLRIWGVTMYEIAEGPEPEQAYARFFEGYVFVTALLFFGVAIMSDLALHLLTTEPFYPSANLLTVLSIAFFAFGLRIHFTVPASLAKNTATQLFPSVCALVLNLTGNLLVVDAYGATGVAWMKVLSFTYLSFHLYFVNRSYMKIPYPFTVIFTVLIGMSCTGALLRSVSGNLSFLSGTALALGVWLLWLGVLALVLMKRYPGIRRELRGLLSRPRPVPHE